MRVDRRYANFCSMLYWAGHLRRIPHRGGRVGFLSTIVEELRDCLKEVGDE